MRIKVTEKGIELKDIKDFYTFDEIRQIIVDLRNALFSFVYITRDSNDGTQER